MLSSLDVLFVPSIVGVSAGVNLVRAGNVWFGTVRSAPFTDAALAVALGSISMSLVASAASRFFEEVLDVAAGEALCPGFLVEDTRIHVPGDTGIQLFFAFDTAASVRLEGGTVGNVALLASSGVRTEVPVSNSKIVTICVSSATVINTTSSLF